MSKAVRSRLDNMAQCVRHQEVPRDNLNDAALVSCTRWKSGASSEDGFTDKGNTDMTKQASDRNQKIKPDIKARPVAPAMGGAPMTPTFWISGALI